MSQVLFISAIAFYAGLKVTTLLAWYIMHQWLQNFADQIDIDPGVFVAE